MLTVYKRIHMGWEGNTAIDFFQLFLDTIADLPDDIYAFSTDKAQYKISQGSIAYDIETGTVYMMQSDGTWVEQG